VYVRVDPDGWNASGRQRLASRPVRNDRRIVPLLVGVDALVELAAEELHSGNTKYQPEHQTDQ